MQIVSLIDEKSTARDLVTAVNLLLRDSFGKNVSGNYRVENLADRIISTGFNNFAGLRGDSHLNLIGIARSSIFSVSYDIAGKFLPNDEMNKDGSRIKVFEEYQKHAKRYAQLYEAISGKGVQITLTDRLDFKDEGITRLK